MIRGEALRADLRRLLAAPVEELPRPEESERASAVGAGARRGRLGQGKRMAVDFRKPGKKAASLGLLLAAIAGQGCTYVCIEAPNARIGVEATVAAERPERLFGLDRP
jgi:hypothetical protein